MFPSSFVPAQATRPTLSLLPLNLSRPVSRVRRSTGIASAAYSGGGFCEPLEARWLLSLRRWWKRSVCGPWTPNKLLSRKFWLTLFVVVVAVGLDIAGRALAEPTLNAVRDVLIAYLAVQGALDWGSRKKNESPGGDE